ncbi:glycosyltransferase [bacterium]|nr:glycosyltransferase [bacterium]
MARDAGGRRPPAHHHPGRRRVRRALTGSRLIERIAKGPRPPRLSLVVIARDEAPQLQRLLSHHRPLWDEAVVVDTGSRDESPIVAAAAGARVTAIAWGDDFAAARNAALGRARGDWALVLDCDEWIAPDEFDAVRACLTAPAGWVFEQRNYCRDADGAHAVPVAPGTPWAPDGATAYRPNLTCRLFPLGLGIRYEGLVHEVPDAAVARAGLALRPCDVAIHHEGHLVQGERLQVKNARYTRLLRLKVARRPRDPKARHELAVQLVAEGHPDLARRLLERTVREFPAHLEGQPARLLLAAILVQGGEVDAGLAQVDAAVRTWPALRTGWVAAVRLHRQAGRPAEAAGYLAEARRLFPADPELAALAGAAAAG